MQKFYRALFRIVEICAIIIVLFLGVCLILDKSIDNFDMGGLLSCRSIEDVREWYDSMYTNDAATEAITVESISYDRYAYTQLNTETQTVYDQILDCILSFKEKITVSTKDSDILESAYEAVMADYGNLFWIKGYQYNTYTSGDAVIELEFAPKYTMNQTQRDAYQELVDDKVQAWLADVSVSDSDFDKAKYVFETLIENVDYNLESEENQNILSVFLYQSTVCQGYADAAWYLLDQLGIQSTVITGTANGESHAWNLVYLDNAYYFMDVTWGNSRYLTADQSTEKRVNYAYMAMTTEEISQTHVITSTFTVPECLSTADNYYVHYGLYFSELDKDAIGNLMADSYNSGDEELSIKFSNSDIYNQAVTYFFDDKHVSDYCSGLQSVYYLMDANANVLTIQWQ